MRYMLIHIYIYIYICIIIHTYTLIYVILSFASYNTAQVFKFRFSSCLGDTFCQIFSRLSLILIWRQQFYFKFICNSTFCLNS